MISYASLERIEGEYAVLEVEKLSVFASIVGDFSKECYMVDVPISFFYDKCISVKTGSVYSVEHDGKNVTEIIRLEEEETRRRIKWLEIQGSIVLQWVERRNRNETYTS